MKKLFLVLLSCILLTACGSSKIVEDKRDQSTTPKPSEKKVVSQYKIRDYFPFKENMRMSYNGGFENSGEDVYIDMIKDNRIQLRVVNGGTTLAKVLEDQDGELRLIASIGEFYHCYDITSAQNSNPEILLKEPLVEGTSWTTNYGKKRFISKVDVDIQTPYGNYKALEVTTEDDEYTIYDYYVRGIGHVKNVFISKENPKDQFVTTLKSIINDASVLQTIKFYYPDFNNEKIVYTQEKILLHTNDTVEKYLEEYLKNPPAKDIAPTISKNTKINQIIYDDKKHKVSVDFSKELITEMNAGSSLENMIIQSITNTLADYFNVDKVYISIEGKPYESGHMALTKNDVFYSNYDDVVELNKR